MRRCNVARLHARLAELYVSLVNWSITMPNLCFKPRKSARTVQLVRHIYSPAIQRSKTVTLGSLALDADPNDVGPALKLRPGIVVTEAEHAEMQRWLLLHGNMDAAERRRKVNARIASTVRTEVLAELSATSGDVFERAAMALDEAAETLPGLADQATDTGESLRAVLRPSYLKVYNAWQHFLKVGQEAGVAKTAKRGARKDRWEQIGHAGLATSHPVRDGIARDLNGAPPMALRPCGPPP